jgi:hypothetical protein
MGNRVSVLRPGTRVLRPDEDGAGEPVEDEVLESLVLGKEGGFEVVYKMTSGKSVPATQVSQEAQDDEDEGKGPVEALTSAVEGLTSRIDDLLAKTDKALDPKTEEAYEPGIPEMFVGRVGRRLVWPISHVDNFKINEKATQWAALMEILLRIDQTLKKASSPERKNDGRRVGSGDR